MINAETSTVPARDAPAVILVVEDEWLVRMVIVDALRDSGRLVVEAANGDEAMAFIQSGAAIDLIFTDVRMPGTVDGLALLAFARQTIPGVPVIVSSGHLVPTEALSGGAAAFVPKPYRVEEVAELIGASLAGRR
ncbi:response regulator [Novosphingobium sp. G106]|uniref:response regulator n=1 Tax=Novosphingobium sp. G106 TaxID=2849500 RepID=UPI001C2D1C78|nr:response regulator [Novosphingobium sp. G106]MBV1691459.1 response regulator [Novosphingobium sp. G106]